MLNYTLARWITFSSFSLLMKIWPIKVPGRDKQPLDGMGGARKKTGMERVWRGGGIRVRIHRLDWKQDWKSSTWFIFCKFILVWFFYIYIWEKLEDTFRLKTRIKICSRFIYYCIGKKEKLDSLYTKLQRSDCALRIILVAIYLCGDKTRKMYLIIVDRDDVSSNIYNLETCFTARATI